MKTTRTSWLSFFLLAIISCNDEPVNGPDGAKSLIVGHWIRQGVVSQDTGCLEGMDLLITVYANGLFFDPAGNVGVSVCNNGKWTSAAVGYASYSFVDNKTVDLVISPGTNDERKLQMQIIKLDKDSFWF